jgi:hypothetical protein
MCPQALEAVTNLLVSERANSAKVTAELSDRLAAASREVCRLQVELTKTKERAEDETARADVALHDAQARAGMAEQVAQRYIVMAEQMASQEHPAIPPAKPVRRRERDHLGPRMSPKAPEVDSPHRFMPANLSSSLPGSYSAAAAAHAPIRETFDPWAVPDPRSFACAHPEGYDHHVFEVHESHSGAGVRREDQMAQPRPRRSHRGPGPGFVPSGFKRGPREGLLRPSMGSGRLHTMRMTNRY